MMSFALAIALQGAAPDRPLISPLMPAIRVDPVPLEQAFAAFKSLCIAPSFDPKAIEKAAAVSDLKFHREGPGRWVSRHGVLNVTRGIGTGVDCDLRIAVSERLEAATLTDRIERAFASGRRRADLGGQTFWDFGRHFGDRLTYSPASPDTRYFSLIRSRSKPVRVL